MMDTEVDRELLEKIADLVGKPVGAFNIRKDSGCDGRQSTEHIEITGKTMKLGGAVPAGEVYVDGSGVGDVGAVVMRDRKRLAEDGMVVVVLPIATQDGALLAPPEIITRGFIYVKESGDLMKELQNVAMDAADGVTGRKRSRDDSELRSAVKSAVSSYLFKNTKRSPMVIPVVTRL